MYLILLIWGLHMCILTVKRLVFLFIRQWSYLMAATSVGKGRLERRTGTYHYEGESISERETSLLI